MPKSKRESVASSGDRHLYSGLIRLHLAPIVLMLAGSADALAQPAAEPPPLTLSHAVDEALRAIPPCKSPGSDECCRCRHSPGAYLLFTSCGRARSSEPGDAQ